MAIKQAFKKGDVVIFRGVQYYGVRPGSRGTVVFYYPDSDYIDVLPFGIVGYPNGLTFGVHRVELDPLYQTPVMRAIRGEK